MGEEQVLSWRAGHPWLWAAMQRHTPQKVSRHGFSAARRASAHQAGSPRRQRNMQDEQLARSPAALRIRAAMSRRPSGGRGDRTARDSLVTVPKGLLVMCKPAFGPLGPQLSPDPPTRSSCLEY